MRYVWWGYENRTTTEPFALGVMPEAKAALEATLSDAHPAMLCAFGEWFRALYFLDTEWTRLHIGAIFPQADDRKAFWEASWHAFVEHSPPYDPAFELLRANYELAIARLTGERNESSERSGERGLGQHLGSYFWRGIGGDGSRDLLLRYFDTCSPPAAADTLFFLGRGLTTEKDIPESTIRALLALWEEIRLRGDRWLAQKRREVARQFSQWFESNHLPADWRLRQLDEILTSGAGLVDAESVLAQLALLVRDHPRAVARCARLLLIDQQQTWYPLMWERESTALLEALLASTDNTAESEARDIINRLVERGNLFARDIARKAGDETTQ
jgi:hypothetical protein